jgi:glycosyltransferase involved in cell wall biosynthesis
MRSIYNDAVHIFAWSNLVRDSLVAHYGIHPEKVSVVPPGVDIKQWTVSPRRNHAAAGGNANIEILFVGGDFLRKGGDILLRIAHRKEFRNYRFSFVTQTFVGTAGNNCSVYTHVEPNSKQLTALYDAADIFVLPTRADFAPTNAICEAMAMQLPVISTNVGGLGEVVRHGETGYITPVDDEDALAAFITTLGTNEDLRRAMGLNARKLLEERYNIENNGNEILHIMKSVPGK